MTAPADEFQLLARKQIGELFEATEHRPEAAAARRGQFDEHPITATLRAGFAALAAASPGEQA